MSTNQILENLENPEFLERTYHCDPNKFEAELDIALKQNPESETLRVWYARLSYVPSVIGKKISITLLVVICLISGALTKIPVFFLIDSEWFYPRYAPLIVFTSLITYFLITTPNIKIRKIVIFSMAICSAYLMVLPQNSDSDSASVTMALVHLPLFSFSLLAVSFMSENWQSVEARIDFIRYIGEMGIYAVLILLGGMVLTGITLGLFSLIDLDIDQWYFEYIVVLGLVSSPLVATYIFDIVQDRQSKFAPILSNVFSPLFLITILAYLIATFYQGKSPFTDRDFLIVFNGLLLVILALTIFSISGKKRARGSQVSDYVNVLLVTATLIVNIVALSAILFRWVEHGTTVNRIVVTGANVLIFFHLVLLLLQYVKHIKLNTGIQSLESTIAKYLPVYTAWSVIVSVLIPVMFKFE